MEDDLENVAAAVVDGLVNVVSTDACAVVTYFCHGTSHDTPADVEDPATASIVKFSTVLVNC